MKKVIIFLLLFTSLAMTKLAGQDKMENMVIRAIEKEGAIQLNWHPTSPAIWQQQLTRGYSIERTELDATGKPVGSLQTIQSNILPKDAFWFEQNKEMEEGLMAPIGSILYDEDFQFEQNELMDAEQMRFNYIVYETIYSEAIAAAVGLGFTDTNVSTNKIYRYTIKANGSATSSDVIIQNTLNAYTQNPSYSPVKFAFPANMSLSEMLAATQPQKPLASVHGLARAYGDSIVLRWAPTEGELWLNALKDGYIITRQEVEGRIDTLAHVFPWKESDLTERIASDSMALAAGAVLHGEQYTKAHPELNFYEQSMIFKTRFGYALLVADRSPLAADILGLRYVDKEVSLGKRYVYSITTASLEDPFFMGRANVVNVFEPLAAPTGLRVVPDDGRITLNWDKSNNSRKYGSYIVEKSIDGQNYTVITPTPIVFGESKDFALKNYFYNDEYVTNYKKYYYRIKGSNSFGEWSEYAYAEGEALDMRPPNNASITNAIYNEDSNEIVVFWEERNGQSEDLASYQVLLAEHPEEDFSAVSPELSKDTSSFVLRLGDMDLDRSFYFTVMSKDVNGNTSQSIVEFANVPDYIPPEPPLELHGEIDSVGKVFIAWAPSLAKDVEGYWIYWGNSPDQEMSLVNEYMINADQNYHSWQVEAVSLNKKIYFCMRAQDDAYNKGKPSEIIEVIRPDYVAPVRPFLTEVKEENGTLKIEWTESTSEDVAGYILYKKIPEETDWYLLDSIQPTDTLAFVDTMLVIDEFVEYAVEAYDDSNNLSEMSNIERGRITFPAEKIVVQNLSVDDQSKRDETSASLQWFFDPGSKQLEKVPYTFEVFRSSGSKALTFYKTVEEASFKDSTVQSNVLYNYAVRVRYSNGWTGDLSEVKSVMVQ